MLKRDFKASLFDAMCSPIFKFLFLNEYILFKFTFGKRSHIIFITIGEIIYPSPFLFIKKVNFRSQRINSLKLSR